MANRSITLHDAAERYLEEKRGRVLGRTLETERARVDEFLAWMGTTKGLDGKGELGVIDVLAKRIQSYVDSLTQGGMLASSVGFRLAPVGGIFRWCVRHGYLRLNPMQFVRMPRVPKQVHRLYTFEEYQRIVAAAAGTPLQWLVVCAFRTGYSMVDVCNLRWEHVNLEEMYISKTRQKLLHMGAAPVTVPILPGSDLHQHLLLLREVPETDDWPGPGYVHHQLASLYQGSQQRVATAYMALMQKLGIKKQFKAWRNTYISALANSGTPTAIACKMSGHSNPAMLAHYVVPDLAAMREATLRANEFIERKHAHQIKITP